MAVFYKWIKGCEAVSSLTSGLWTYLKWGSGTTGVGQMPTLHVNAGKNDTTQATNLGYILTNKMPSSTIFSNFNFKSRLYITDPSDTSYTSSDLNNTEILKIHRGGIYTTDSRFIIEAFNKMKSTDTTQLDVYTDLLLHSKYSLLSGTQYLGVDQNNTQRTSSDFGKWRIQINEYLDGDIKETTLPDGVIVNGSVKIRTGQSTDMHNNLYVEGGMYLGTQFNADGTIKSNSVTATFPAFGDTSGTIDFHKGLNVYSSITSSGNISGSLLKATNYCEAPFFNATSDRRAKENIKPATYNALELIKKLPVYTYNYKNQPETVTGIIAQDLFAVQPEELDLVSNTNATGKDGDYMSIKNDKLMFVLMKAIQEQQEQIEQLQAEIRILKKA